MNLRVRDFLGITQPQGEATPLWSGLASAIAAVLGALFAVVIDMPFWTIILLYVLSIVALALLTWRLATDPPRARSDRARYPDGEMPGQASRARGSNPPAPH
jgi:membrane protein implicated in regulation of membrane protease activity